MADKLCKVQLLVIVEVDPTSGELWDAIWKSRNCQTALTDVVRNEIASNLESVSYVRHVIIVPKPKGGES